MKKLLVLLALCMVLCVVFVACDEPVDEPEETTAGTTEATTTAPGTETTEPGTETTEPGTETTEPGTETTEPETTTEETTEPPAPVFEGNWHASVDSFMYCVNDDFSDVVDFSAASTNKTNGTTITNSTGETLASVTANYVYFANGWLAVDGYAIENWVCTIYAADGTLLKTVDLTLKEAEVGVVNHVSQNMGYAEGTVSHRVGQIDAEIISLKDFQGQNVTVVYSIGLVGTEFTVDLIKLDVAVPVDPNAPLFVLDAAAMAGATNMNETASITASADGTYATFVGANDGQYGDAWVSLIASPTQAAQFIAIKYRTSLDRDGQIFIGSGQGPSGSGDCPMIDYTSDGKWQLAIVDLSTVTAVNAETYQINYLRYDFFTNGKDDATIDVAYIAAFNTAEAALAYDAQLGYEDLYEVDMNTEANAAIYDGDGFPEAGLPNATFCKLGYNNVIALGTMDLSQFIQVRITYSCDGSDLTAGRFENSSSLAIGLKSQGTSYGQETTDNFDGNLACTDMVFSSGSWTDIRTAVVDLSEVFYNGDVWVAIHNPEGTEVLIHSITFVYGEKEAPAPEMETVYYDGNNGTMDIPVEGVKYFVRGAAGQTMTIAGAYNFVVTIDNLNGSSKVLQANMFGEIVLDIPEDWFTFELTIDNVCGEPAYFSMSFETPAPEINTNLVIGENLVTAIVTKDGWNDTFLYDFTAEEAGTYTFTLTADYATGSLYYFDAPVNGMCDDNTVTLTLEAGQTVTVGVSADVVMGDLVGATEDLVYTLALNVTKA